MRAIVVATALLVALAATASAETSAASAKVQFEAFKAKYGKRYSSPEEEAARLANFAANLEKAAELQAANPHATFGVTPLSDLSETEFRKRHLNAAPGREALRKSAKATTISQVTPKTKNIKSFSRDAVNYVAQGAVTSVKNEGDCGSCWAFSIVAPAESAYYLTSGILESMSEQEFLDCDTSGAYGCDGGLPGQALEWVISNRSGQLYTESSWPYTGEQATCSYSGKTPAAQITAFSYLPQSESQIADYVYDNGPVSVAVDAVSWQTYTGGVLTSCSSSQLDFSATVVGFNKTANPPYWLIKNQWGAAWGENGYIKVEYGTNQCNISGEANAVVVAGQVTQPPSGSCSSITDCYDCTAAPSGNCGWCANTMTCSQGTSNGPNSGTCAAWDWTSNFCPATPAPPGEGCSQYTTCKSCTEAGTSPLCGWCATTLTCSAGTSSGPSSGSCISWDWLSNTCPAQ
jgi:C1A family cysteine protease